MRKGRVSIRRTGGNLGRTTELNGYPDFPHLGQRFAIERLAINKKRGKRGSGQGILHSEEELSFRHRGEIDVVVFTSSSSVSHFVNLIGDGGTVSLPKGIKVACICPKTAQAAVEHRFQPDVVAEEHTVEGLVTGISLALHGDSSNTC